MITRVFWISLWILLFANTLIATDLGSLSKYFVNDKIRRVVDLTNSIVREDIIIRANNTRNMALTEYYMAIPQQFTYKLSSFQVVLKQKPEEPLDIQNIGFDEAKKCYVFKIPLDEPVEPNGKVVLQAKIAYIHVLEPLPQKIPQLSRQHVILKLDIFFYSPYHTNEIKSTFRTPSSNIVNILDGDPHYPSERTGDLVTYGPFHDIEPYAFISSRLHYEFKPAILTLTQLTRELEVSHWGGNIAIEEHFALRHDGAELDKQFNRIQFQVSPHALEQTNVLAKLQFELPQDAKDVYYRDEVGNVSTSQFRREKSRSVLEIQPRFPLFGGWKTTWYTGYNVPIKHYVRYVKQKGIFVLKAKFVENMGSMAADQVIFRIILPEGAIIEDIETPNSVEMDSIEQDVHYTFFDSTGRPTITFKRRNVISDHELPVIVTYKYSTLNLFQKPLVVSAALFVIYIGAIILSKLPYSIGQDQVDTIPSPISPVVFVFDENEPVAENTRAKKPHVSPAINIGSNQPTTATSRKKKSGKRVK